jgi:hypothetical protein
MLRLPFVGEVRIDDRAQLAGRGAIATATDLSSVKPAGFHSTALVSGLGIHRFSFDSLALLALLGPNSV